jgi:hypothetical protein
MSELDDISCRICLEPAHRDEVIAPCSCAGSQKWVHRSCLDTWRTTREDRAFSKCTECLTPYELVAASDDSSLSYWRHMKFYCLCARDILMGLLCIGAGTAIFSYWVYVIDKNSDKKLIKSLHATGLPSTFYIFCGLFVLLAFVGLIGTMGYCCGTQTRHCVHACDGCNGIYCPLYMTDSPGCCGCAACSDCTCCELGACAEMGEAAVVIILIGLVIFAIIGVFIGIFIGADFIQRVTRRHIHVLRKQSLAEDYIVMDLAAGTDIEMGALARMPKENISNGPTLLSTSISSPYLSSSRQGSYAPIRAAERQSEGQDNIDGEHVIFGNLSTEQQRQLVRLGLA